MLQTLIGLDHIMNKKFLEDLKLLAKKHNLQLLNELIAKLKKQAL